MFFHLLTFFDLKNIHAAGIIDQSIFIIDLYFPYYIHSPPFHFNVHSLDFYRTQALHKINPTDFQLTNPVSQTAFFSSSAAFFSALSLASASRPSTLSSIPATTRLSDGFSPATTTVARQVSVAAVGPPTPNTITTAVNGSR